MQPIQHIIHFTLRTQVCDELWPFRSENICTSQGTISSADHKCIDAFLDQIVGCRQPPLRSTECFRTCCPDQCSALCMSYQTCVIPSVPWFLPQQTILWHRPNPPAQYICPWVTCHFGDPPCHPSTAHHHRSVSYESDSDRHQWQHGQPESGRSFWHDVPPYYRVQALRNPLEQSKFHIP